MGPTIVRGNGKSVWIFDDQADERAALVAIRSVNTDTLANPGMREPIRTLQLDLFGQ